MWSFVSSYARDAPFPGEDIRGRSCMPGTIPIWDLWMATLLPGRGWEHDAPIAAPRP